VPVGTVPVGTVPVGTVPVHEHVGHVIPFGYGRVRVFGCGFDGVNGVCGVYGENSENGENCENAVAALLVDGCPESGNGAVWCEWSLVGKNVNKTVINKVEVIAFINGV